MIYPSGPEHAKIMLVGEMPHEQDLLNSAPFVGGPGFELRKMLNEVGLFAENCYITLVMSKIWRLRKSRTRRPHADFAGGLATKLKVTRGGKKVGARKILRKSF